MAAWMIAAVLLIFHVAPADPSQHEAANLLPPDAAYSRALDAFAQSFPASSGLSELVIIFERPDAALSDQDRQFIEGIANAIVESGLMPPRAAILSPGRLPLQPNPMISPLSQTGQAGLIRLSLPGHFVTVQSAKVVQRVRELLAQKSIPQGLNVAVTGSSGFGYDYAEAAKTSHRRTIIATLLAVTIILLLVYRAPLAAVVPLGAISLAAIVAVKLLSLGSMVGLHFGTAESIFVIVLIYGAGVDYSLLLISRYREFCDEGLANRPAVAASLRASLGTILAAAGTNILGLLMLRFAQYSIFRSTGPAVAIGLTIALLAALTLVPAMLAILGNRLFWPHVGYTPPARRKLWPAVAGVVTGRPWLTLIITIAAMTWPVWRGVNQPWVYDTLASIPVQYSQNVGNAAAGMQIARRHWPIGEIAPIRILVQSPQPLTPQQWQQVSTSVTDRLQELRDPQDQGPLVANIRSLCQPLGKNFTDSTPRLMAAVIDRVVQSLYIGDKGLSTRLDVMLQTAPLDLRTMQAMATVRDLAHDAARESMAIIGRPDLVPQVHLTGATAEMAEIREVTQHDFKLIAALVLGVIFLIMLALIRRVGLSLFMVVSTVASYFATLGLCRWMLVSLPPLLGLEGYGGLDWKVEIFLFVVMVAVGQDYNIFLAGRLMQEWRRQHIRPAAYQALVHTGPVISSCGVIMAATLGSLMVGQLALLVQLGFALALGMLIDTFIVRPLLLPAFAVLTGRLAIQHPRRQEDPGV